MINHLAGALGLETLKHTHTHRDKKKRYSKGFCFNKKLFNLISTVCILVKLSSGGVGTKRLKKGLLLFGLPCLSECATPTHSHTHRPDKRCAKVRRGPSGPSSGRGLSHRSVVGWSSLYNLTRRLNENEMKSNQITLMKG